MNGFVTALKSELLVARNTFSSKFILFAPAVFAILQSLLVWATETGTYIDAHIILLTMIDTYMHTLLLTIIDSNP